MTPDFRRAMGVEAFLFSVFITALCGSDQSNHSSGNPTNEGGLSRGEGRCDTLTTRRLPGKYMEHYGETSIL